MRSGARRNSSLESHRPNNNTAHTATLHFTLVLHQGHALQNI